MTGFLEDDIDIVGYIENDMEIKEYNCIIMILYIIVLYEHIFNEIDNTELSNAMDDIVQWGYLYLM